MSCAGGIVAEILDTLARHESRDDVATIILLTLARAFDSGS